MPRHKKGPPAESLWRAALARGEVWRAREILEERLAWSRQHEDSSQTADALADLARLLVRQSAEPLSGGLAELGLPRSDLTQARDLYEEVLALYRQQHVQRSTAEILERLAELASSAGDTARTMQLYEESLAAYRASPYPPTEAARVLVYLGDLARARGDTARATALYEESYRALKDDPSWQRYKESMPGYRAHEDDPSHWERHASKISALLFRLADLALERGETARADALRREGEAAAGLGRLRLFREGDVEEQLTAEAPPLVRVTAVRADGRSWWRRLLGGG